MSGALVIGLGNRWRGDDALGPMVLDGLRANLGNAVDLLESPGDSLTLINAWQKRDCVYLIDACRDDSLDDGHLVTIDNALADSASLKQLHHPTSSHVLDVEQAIAMSRAMGTAPDKLVIYAVVASQFSRGSDPGAAVQSAVGRLVKILTGLLSTTRQQAG